MNLKPLSVLAFSLILSACGGGGGGGSDSPAAPAPNTPSAPVTTPSTPATTVTGAVTKGPVSGATVELFEVDAFGNPVGVAVATGTTGEDGTFQIQAESDIDLLLIASGGSFIDESDQETDIALKRRIELADGDSFLSFVPAGQVSVAVTPITTALVLRGRILGGPDGTFSEKFFESKATMDAQAGFDVISTIPANPVAPATDATEAEKQYALLLGGIANLINNVAIQSGLAAPTYDLVVAVTFDLVDGRFDGNYFGSINVPASGQDPVQLPQNLDFSEEVTRFRNNNFANFEDTVVPSIEVTTFFNNAPTADAGQDISVAQTGNAQLDGSGSTDADSGLFFSWVQTEGTPVTLDDPMSPSPSFTAPAKFIGNETLSFELTVIDTVGFTSLDTVSVQVVGSLSDDFYVVDVDSVSGPGVGIDIDGGGRITLTDATNGTLLTDIGSQPFTYTTTENTLTLNFATPFDQDDFDEERDPDGDGEFEFVLVEERIDQFIFTLVTDNPNGDRLTIQAVGEEVLLPLDDPDGVVLGTAPISITEPIVAFDVAQATPFSISAGDRRALHFNSADVITSIGENDGNDDELFVEIFEFTTATSGMTRDSAQPFTYSVDGSGHLLVNFSNGDSAKYINLTTRPSGDVVATEYVLAEPFFPDESPEVTDVYLSFPENTSVAKPANMLEVAGVYSGLIDSQDDGANLQLRLNPDGTGSVNIDIRANETQFFDFDDVFTGRSSLGVCWSLDGDSNIVVNRAFSLNVAYPNSFSSETDTSFCSAQTDETTDLRFVLTQFDVAGSTYKHFTQNLRNSCAFVPTTDCMFTPTLETTGFGLRITDRVPLTATPPVAALDPVQTPDATPITIDLLANDIARDNPIDVTSVQLGRGPFQGAITSFDQNTGILVYTPDPGIRSDLIEYTVADTAGNRSNVQITQIDISPCAEIDGQRGSFDVFTKDCDYSGLGGPINPVMSDVSFGPLPDGGVHRFTDSFVIGQDYSTDADLAAAGISQGGDGPTLNIAAGTVMAFSNPSDVLSVSRGSQINVGGTPTEPVILTSQIDIDSKRDVDGGGMGFQNYNDVAQWGGVLIQGFGVINACSYSGSVGGGDLALISECHFQAPTLLGHIGGNNNLDNSGAINYLQVKYAGGFSGTDPAGGFGLGAVGSGTSISNVQVYSAAADGIQLAGGAVDLQNVVVLYAKIAGVIADLGYSGTVSNALIIQDRFSGEFCADSAGADSDLFSPTQIDAIITQGINSRATLSNFTCVISADGFDTFPGNGFDFIEGAGGTLVDSIAFVPGRDRFTNYCLDTNDQSLQLAQDGDLTFAGNLFACASTTPNILPDLSPLQSLFEGGNNQFALLTQGISHPPPTATAGTGNVLIEGSPLIFAPAQANLQIDGSPVTVMPQGAFIGAVQQSADWTDGWTFGLRPESSLAPLWYDQPILDVPGFVPAAKGELLTLDASGSISSNGGLTFQWNQLQGDPVNFTNPTSASTQLTAPGAGTNLTFAPEVAQLELVVTDSGGVEARQIIDVFPQPQIPDDFYATTEFIIPFQFLRNIGDGPRVQLDLTNNTGTFIYPEGIAPFTWTDSPTDFVMDFASNGGLVEGPNTSFEDVDGDTMNGQEEITRTVITDDITYTLVSQDGVRTLFTETVNGTEQIFDVTNSVALPEEVFVNESGQNSQKVVVGVNNGVFIGDIEGGELISLPTNLSTNFPALFNPDLLAPDRLQFNGDGTGFAELKNVGFSWDTFEGRILSINFNDGEFAEYVKLFEGELGDAFGVTYNKTNGDQIATTAGVLTDEPFFEFATLPSVSGIYVTNEAFELDDGSFVDAKLFYRLHPDGSGQLEIENFDPVTGNLSFIGTSSNGICWQLEGSNTLIWNRLPSQDARHPGVNVPTLTDCAAVNTTVPDNTLVNLRRNIQLFDTNGSGQLLTFTENLSNQALLDTMGGDPTIVDFTDTFIRNFEPLIPFVGNPPLAVADSFTATSGLLSVENVVANDVAGDAGIDPLAVTIEVGPANGVASVDPATGEIQYTSNMGFMGNDTVQYRVFDVLGNPSTIGLVIFNVND